VLSGYLVLAEKLCSTGGGTFAEPWNFGPEEVDEWPVRRVVDTAATLWGSDASWVQDTGAHPVEAQLLRLDCTKARTVLGWRARWSMEQALTATIEWYKAFYGEMDVRELTMKQIGQHSGC